VRHKSFITNNK